MITLGLVGGVASGKSAAARLLAEQIPGAIQIDADKLGHEILEVTGVVDALIARWGAKILDQTGRVSRSAIARIVFASGAEEDLRFLESQTHPLIRQRIRLMKTEAVLAGVPVVIVDAALLLETEWGELCDLIVFVDTPAEQRLQRALTRKGWDAAEFQRREAAQWSTERKREAADEILPNSGTPADLAIACQQLWQKIQAQQGNSTP